MKVNLDEFCPCSEHSKITRRRETCPINFKNSAGTPTDLHGNVHKQCKQLTGEFASIFDLNVCAYKPNG